MPGRRARRVRALVLDRTKLREQDLIVTVVTREGSQLRAVAKGARKPGSRLAARSELFCDVDLLVSEGRGLGIVQEAQIVDAHEGIRGDVERLACASAMCEVCRLMCLEDVEDPFLHPLLSRALLACEQAQDRAHLDVTCAAYVFKVLAHGGWRPVLDSCVACGEDGGSRFSVLAGGMLCESCAREVAGAHPMDPGLRDWLAALVGATFDVLVAAPVDAMVASDLISLAHEWAATHLDSRLRAMEFFSVV